MARAQLRDAVNGLKPNKGDADYTELQNQLSRIEEEIAGARRYYNAVVTKYNTRTEIFPSSIVAGIFGFERKPLYEVNTENERESVKVSF